MATRAGEVSTFGGLSAVEDWRLLGCRECCRDLAGDPLEVADGCFDIKGEVAVDGCCCCRRPLYGVTFSTRVSEDTEPDDVPWMGRVVPLDRLEAAFALDNTDPGAIASMAAIKDNTGLRVGFDIRLMKVSMLIRWLVSEPKLEVVCCDFPFIEDAELDFIGLLLFACDLPFRIG